MRTHHCNELNESHIGQTVTLIGWVNSARDHGGVIFIDLRDREGLTQCVFRPEEGVEVAALSHTLRDEDVVRVTGKVAKRLEGADNVKMATGSIEVVAGKLEIVNKADVLPFQLDKELSNEDIRMTCADLAWLRTSASVARSPQPRGVSSMSLDSLRSRRPFFPIPLPKERGTSLCPPA
jgi:aspartyl-tRNA synthetase